MKTIIVSILLLLAIESYAQNRARADALVTVQVVSGFNTVFSRSDTVRSAMRSPEIKPDGIEVQSSSAMLIEIHREDKEIIAMTTRSTELVHLRNTESIRLIRLVCLGT
ncbi:MAG: hypothetical protein V1799_01300 [bacterium]